MSDNNALHSSLTDMMTSLMVIFILLLVNYLRNEQVAAAKALEAPKQARTSIKEELQAQLSGDAFRDVKVYEDPNDPYQLIVVIPDDLLFDTGLWDLSPGARLFLSDFSPKFGSVICSTKFLDKIQSFVIEGYTDNDPVRGQKWGNLQLSQQRSFAVLAELLTGVADLQPCFQKLSSASGRGEEGCMASPNATGAEKARCRRVDFRIRVKSEAVMDVRSSAEELLPGKVGTEPAEAPLSGDAALQVAGE